MGKMFIFPHIFFFKVEKRDNEYGQKRVRKIFNVFLKRFPCYPPSGQKGFFFNLEEETYLNTET